MARTQGSKNTKISRYDITQLSLETIQEAIRILVSKIKYEELTIEQKEEVLLLYEKMTRVLKDGKHHINKDYQW